MRRKMFMVLLIAAMSLELIACGGVEDASYEESAYTTDSYDSSGFDYSDSYMVDGFELNDSYGVEEVASTEELAENSDASDSADENVKSEDTDASGSENTDSSEYTTERKIVYTSSLDIETKNFDQDVESIRDLVSANDGFMEYTSVYGSEEDYGRTADFNVRIPVDNYNSFMDSVGSIGSVTYSDENANDITSDYVDVQARIKALKTKLSRLEELEQNATTVEDLLAIEDRINEVQTQIEQYTAQIKMYDNQVSYSTVYITVEEVVTYTEKQKDTFGRRVLTAISSSCSHFVSFVQTFIIGVIYVLPYILVALVILGIVWFATRKSRAAGKLRKQQYNNYVKQCQMDEAPGEYAGPVYTNNLAVNEPEKQKPDEDSEVENLDEFETEEEKVDSNDSNEK